MSHYNNHTTIVSRNTRENTLEGLVRAPRFLMSSLPPSILPLHDSSSDTSANSKFTMGISTVSEFLEHPGVGYSCSHLDSGHGHHGRKPFKTERGYKVGVHPIEDAVVFGHPTIPRQRISNSRGQVDSLPSGFRSDQIFYTEDSHIKPTQRIRRQCFNCKSTDTSAWRRSLLNSGKMLCNRCGLFERTHALSRPERLSRRKSLGLRPSHPSMRSGQAISPEGAVNPPHQEIHVPSSPRHAHLFDALNPISGKSIPHMLWASPVAPDAPSSPPHVLPCYPPSSAPSGSHMDLTYLSHRVS